MDDGELVSDQVKDVLDIIRPIPRQRFAPQQVVILPGLGVSVLNWLQVEPVVLEECQGTAVQSVVSIRRALYTMAGREKPNLGMNVQDGFSMIAKVLAERIMQTSVGTIMEESKEYILSIFTKSIE